MGKFWKGKGGEYYIRHGDRAGDVHVPKQESKSPKRKDPAMFNHRLSVLIVTAAALVLVAGLAPATKPDSDENAHEKGQGQHGASHGFAIVVRNVSITDVQSAIATLMLPAGKYIVNASIFANNDSGTLSAPIICSFTPFGLGGFFAMQLQPFVSDAIPSGGTLAMTNAIELLSPGPVSAVCVDNAGPGASATINTVQMTAIRVRTLTEQH